MKRLTIITTGLALGMLAATVTAQRAPQRNWTRTPDAIVTTSLTTALMGESGEYAAYATYQAVIEKYGQVQPFVRILNAETRHIAALKTQMQKYGMTVPENPWKNVEVPASLTDAALLGIEIEEDNAAMYEELLTHVASYPNLVQVFSNLQSASTDNHLPAFEAAAEGNYTDVVCPLGTMTPEQQAECRQQRQTTLIQLRQKQAAGTLTETETAWLSRLEQTGGCCANGTPQGGHGTGPCDGTGPRAQMGTCPMAGNAATASASAAGQTVGKGQGRLSGRGQGIGMGLRNGIGPRSADGTCPVQNSVLSY